MVDKQFDFFISCSIESSIETKKWHEEFISLFEMLAKKILKRSVKIASSYQFDKDGVLAKKAPVDVFKNTAIFITIVNEDYIKSTKASQELATIFSALKSDQHSVTNSHNKVFKILTSELTKEKHPEQIKELQTYTFYQKDKNNVIPINFSGDDKFETNKKYWLRLIDLLYSATKQLSQTIVQKNTMKTVYLAEAGKDQFVNREVLRRELIHFGYKVLPEKELPIQIDKSKSYVTECLKQSDLSVHIFGSDEGRALDDNNKMLAFQNKISSKFKNDKGKSIKRLLWLPPDIVFEHENQRINIEKLKRDSAALKGAELIQTAIEEFKSILHMHLSQDKRVEAIENIKPVVYLMFSDEQKDDAQNLINSLNTENLDFIALEKAANDKELLSKHRKNLVACNGVIIFHDGSNIDWVRSKRNDIVKSIGFGRTSQIQAKALYITRIKEFNQPGFVDFNVFDGNKILSMDSTKPFIEKLKQ